MSSFILLQITVKDPAKIEEYYNAAPPTVAAFGGELVFRSRISNTISGSPQHTAAVVLKFPDKASGAGWYDSEDYQNLIENRDEGAEVVATQYDPPDFF